MSKSLLTISLLLSFIMVFSQNKRALELSLLGRYDSHANYVTNFGGRTQNDTIQIYGASFGIGLQFHQVVAKNLMVYAGLGFYRLGVNKINTTQRPFSGISHYRPIDYYDGTSRLLYGTNQYHYNNISYTVGAEWTFAVKPTHSKFISLEFVDYSTFSQRYNIPRNNATYGTSRTGQLGWGVNTSVGFQKQLGRIYIKPALLVPVYQRIKGDEVFTEKPDKQMNKWFSGVGLSIKIGKHL
jgi:hypothetical protein